MQISSCGAALAHARRPVQALAAQRAVSCARADLRCNLLVAAFTALLALAVCNASHGGALALLQHQPGDAARPWTWAMIRQHLPMIRQAGYTAILLSPHEKACGGGFSLGYDPYDFRSFDSAHGNEGALRALIAAAHQQQLQVYADMVLNHMCGNHFAYPRFGPGDFHPSAVIQDWNNQSQLENGSLFGFDDLKQESPYVRGELFNYLVKTNNLGFDGFRWDAAKHVPQWYWRVHVLANTRKWGKYSFGEVYNGNVDYLASYAALGMAVTDYALYFQLRDSFRFGGNLAALDRAGLAGRDGANALTFVENQDVAPPANRLLAYAFISAYPGYPMYFRVDLQDAAVNTLIWVQNHLASGPYAIAYKSADALVFFRGERLLAGINQGEVPLRQRITTPWRNARVHDHTGHVADAWTDATGVLDTSVPAGSYVMLAPSK